MTHTGPITEDDRDVIKEAYRRSAAISWLSKYYHTTEDHIADILGLPKNKQARDKLHRDHNFYDHGFGEERALERSLEFYGEFLDDGDFEKYQPCCYMDRQSPEFLILKKEAESIQESEDPHREIRRLWILNRFTEYQLHDWAIINEKIKALLPKTGWNYSEHLRGFQ